MDLSLQLGRPVEALAREMTERELQLWVRYARERMLPARRIELYLAQLSFICAKGLGVASANATVEDYLFDGPADPEGDDDNEGDDLEQLMEAFDFRPSRKDGGDGV